MDNPIGYPSPDGRYFILTEMFRWYHPLHFIYVPVGFKTDFASVPRFFWRIIPPWGKYMRAALIHDWLYYSGEVSKKTADKIFRDVMKEIKVKKWKIKTMFWAVKFFGFKAWNNHRKRRENLG